MSGGLLVLGWHNVEPTWFFRAEPGAGTRGLHRQLGLVASTCNVVPLEEALDTLRAGLRLPRRSVALTFDDGYRDALVAASLLEHRGLPATFFLVPELLSGRALAWWEQLGQAVWTSSRRHIEVDGAVFSLGSDPARQRTLGDLATLVRRSARHRRAGLLAAMLDALDAPAHGDPASLFLTWGEAAELLRRGHAIGSHSLTHAALSTEPADDLVGELGGSKAVLEERLGVEVRTIAYPYGNPEDLDERTEAAAVAAGYDYALTSIPGVNEVGAQWLRLKRQLLEPSGHRGLLVLRHSFGGLRGITRLLPRRKPGFAAVLAVAGPWLSGAARHGG